MSSISNATYLDIFYNALRIRLVEERIAARYSDQKMRCPTHLSIGQELPAAIVSQCLREGDCAVSSHRAHAHYLAKGGNLKGLIAEIYGKETGCSKGIGGSMHLIDKSVNFMGSTAIVGNSIPVGVGLALAQKQAALQQISCIYFGDGATEEGVYYESLNFAAVKSLPALFVCEQNLYSVYSPLSVRQPKERSIAAVSSAMGVTSLQASGYNVEDTLEKALQLIKHIRATSTPGLLEISTYRWREHCGPNFDNSIGYREENEFFKWQKIDPLQEPLNGFFGQFLNPKMLADYHDQISKEIDEAFEFAEASSFPDATALYQGEFA